MPYALRLPNNGAWPMTPHRFFDPTPGSARALIVNVTPGDLVALDERGIPLEEARKWADDQGCALELVQIDAAGNEVTAQPKITKAELVAYAAALDPPLELHDSQTRDEMHAAIAEHEAAIASEGQTEGDTSNDTTEGS